MFAKGAGVDLSSSDISGVTFKIRGNLGSVINVQIGTPLAQWVNVYYKITLQPTPSWALVSVSFDQFTVSKSVPYTLDEVLRNATSLVWECDQVGANGWFVLDDVWLLTPTSTVVPPGGSTSGAAGQSSLSLLLLVSAWVSFGLML